MHRKTALAALAIFAQVSTSVSQAAPYYSPGQVVTYTYVSDGTTSVTTITAPGGPLTTSTPVSSGGPINSNGPLTTTPNVPISTTTPDAPISTTVRQHGPSTTNSPGNPIETAIKGYETWIQNHTETSFIVFCVVAGLLAAVSIALAVLTIRLCAARRRTKAARRGETDHIRLLASQNGEFQPSPQYIQTSVTYLHPLPETTGSSVYNSYPSTPYGYDPYKEGTGV